MKRIRRLSFLFVEAVALAVGQSQAQETVALFNGVDLSGWSILGGDGEFDVTQQDGSAVIRGVSADTSQNTFLVTDLSYDDFVLELEFWIDQPSSGPNYNSGIQIRSRSISEHNNGRLFGYQVEIDPSDRSWSGGLYFEGGSPERSAGWLDDLSDNESARQAFQAAEWNHFRIEALGNRIQTWINDVPAADYTDSDAAAFLPDGFIGLQVHRVTSGSMEIRFRNLILEPITSLEGDFNADRSLDEQDYAILMQSMFSFSDVDLEADLNADGFVDYGDHRVFQKLYESMYGHGAFQKLLFAVPEPTTLLLSLCLLTTQFSYRHRMGVSSKTR